MSYLPVLREAGSGLATSRLERQVSKEITRAKAGGAVLAAQESAKVEAIEQVAETALMATSHISAIEALLIDRTPHAEARLKHIADAGCAGMANVVLRIGSRV